MKHIVFTRQDAIEVWYNTTLQDVNNIGENFTIADVRKIDTYLEQKLFHSFDKKIWTLSELIFFAINNEMCLTIYDTQLNIVKKYGYCINQTCNTFKINSFCLIINSNKLIIN